MSNLVAGLIFLINTLFDLYLYVLAVRLILAWVGAEYYHPITQFITRLTQFLIKPLKRFIPNIRKVETATVVAMLVIAMIKYLLIFLLAIGLTNPIGLFVIGIADCFRLLLQTFTYAILIQAILSWIQPGAPINSLLFQFTSPIMRPLQRLIPLVGGVDITPIPAIIILQLLIIVVANPLTAVGQAIAI